MSKSTRQQHLIRGSLLAAVGASVLAVAGLALFALSYERAYAGRFLPGITILGVGLDGKTYAEASEAVGTQSETLLTKHIILHFSDGTTERVTPRDIGMTIDPDGLLRQGYQQGRSGTLLDRWTDLATLFASRTVYALAPSFDIDQFMRQIELRLVAHEKIPTSAQLVITDGKLIIAPEKSGLIVDRSRLRHTLEPDFATLTLPDTVDIFLEEITADLTAQDLQPLLTEAQRVSSASLQLVVGERTFTLPAATLMTWLAIDSSTPDLPLTWNTEAVRVYVDRLATKINRPMVPRKLNDRTNLPITEGSVGLQLATEDAVEQIEAALGTRLMDVNIGEQTINLPANEIAIEEQAVPPPSTPGLYPGKYLEVNLTEQTLYQWEGTTLVARYLVSTGKWDMPTPQGTLYIKNHIAYAYSKKYNLFMPYWLGLAWNPDGSGYEGYGMHDLPEWKNGTKEGENHLGRPVSHGCIRLGTGPAQLIYEWAPEGTPVYIHR